MGELLNRNLQREILTRLSSDYPATTDIAQAFGEPDDNSILVNVAYLEEHGLLKAEWVPSTDDDRDFPADAKISAKGLDFLAEDGGLGAILGVVTVKFDDTTLRALLADRVARSDGDAGEKETLIAKIKTVPAEVLTDVAKRLAERGIEQLPAGVGALRLWLGF